MFCIVVRRSCWPEASCAYLSGIVTAAAAARVQSRRPIRIANGIYAEGMVESDQPSGENINIYPEVPGTVKQILVAEGQEVKKGQPFCW